MMKLTALKIDPEFQRQIPPPNFQEEHQLERNIMEAGRLLTPIILWNGYILDGHTRYRILKKYPFIQFEVQELDLPDRYAAIAWICKNQLGRRNLSLERFKFLIGKQYGSEKQSAGFHGNQHTSVGKSGGSQNGNHHKADKTCERIAKEHNIGKNTVIRAEKFANGVEAAEDAVPGAKEEILTGMIKATDAEIISIARAPKEKRPEIIAELRKEKKDRDPAILCAAPAPEEPAVAPAVPESRPTEIREQIRGHKRQITPEERERLQKSLDSRYYDRAVANGPIMMCEVQGAKEDFIRRWKQVFQDYPDIFEDHQCKKEIRSLTEDAIQYLQMIKEKTL